MMAPPWPFREPSGKWDERGTTWRWRAPGITVEQATALTNLAGWSWSVRELYDGGYEFTLIRRSAEPEPEEAPPKRRRHRWSGAAK